MKKPLKRSLKRPQTFTLLSLTFCKATKTFCFRVASSCGLFAANIIVDTSKITVTNFLFIFFIISPFLLEIINKSLHIDYSKVLQLHDRPSNGRAASTNPNQARRNLRGSRLLHLLPLLRRLSSFR